MNRKELEAQLDQISTTITNIVTTLTTQLQVFTKVKDFLKDFQVMYKAQKEFCNRCNGTLVYSQSGLCLTCNECPLLWYIMFNEVTPTTQSSSPPDELPTSEEV